MPKNTALVLFALAMVWISGFNMGDGYWFQSILELCIAYLIIRLVQIPKKDK